MRADNLKEAFLNIKKTLDDITLYAAALSFYTVFALVPLILVILSIFASSPFFNEFYTKLESFLASNLLPTNQELLLHYIRHFLSNSAKMGIMGGIYIIITSILFFDNYETIISKICKKPKRNFWEKIKLYWTMLTLFPMLFSTAVYLSVKFQFLLEKSSLTSWINILSLLPFLLMWGLFFLAYKLTLFEAPTKKTLSVSFFVTFLFFVSKNIFIYYILINKTYSTLYEGISILIFLFLWIYISWSIFILGVFLIKESFNIDLIKKNG